jgi:hypothetical protein
MKKRPNMIAPCTHPVPPNQYGIFALHCRDNQPLGMDDLERFIAGPIADAEPTFLREQENVAG